MRTFTLPIQVFLLLFFIVPINFVVSAADIIVRSDRNPVGLNESFTLVYETSGSVDGDPDFSPLRRYLDILGQGQNSNISVINGKVSSKKSWRLTVMPLQVGEMTLPPIRFGKDQSPAFQLNVNQASNNPQDGADFFTRIKIDQKQVYVQQQLIVTQQLFSAKNLSALSLGEFQFDTSDVIVERLGDEKQYQTRVGEKSYLVVEKSVAVYPQITGPLKIQPVLAEAQLSSSSSSLFGSLGSRGKIMRARSQAHEVEVLPIPPQSNMNPWLPAQQLQLMEDWPSEMNSFVQGEPVTRTLSIKAEGLTAAQIPTIPDENIDGLKQYPDQPMLNDIKNDSGITGYRVEKIAFVPTLAGTLQLPAIEIPWWNTKTNRREVARIPAREITVQGVSGSETIEDVQPEQKKEAKSVVLSTKPVQEVAHRVIETGPWKIMAILFAVAWLITLLSWYLKSRRVMTKEKTEAAIQTSVKKSYKALESACKQAQASECRKALLAWAKQVFGHEQVQQLADIYPKVSDEFRTEIQRLEASLYANKPTEVDFDRLLTQAKLLTQRLQSASLHTKDILEPLYP